MVSLDYTLTRIKQIDILPTFPDIIGSIIKIIEDPMSSASDLARKMDPSMVGEVMRVANTAYFGTRNFRNISTIEHAIAIIGYDHLSYILLQMPFLTMVQADDEAFDRVGFIRHSISTGVVAKVISSTLHMGNPHEVYISGIVHDIGTIIIYQNFRKAWNQISSMVHGGKMARLAAEREVFSVDHGYIGAVLLDNWNIPRSITEGVMFHHCPDRSQLYRHHALVTHLGNEFSKRVDFDVDLVEFDSFLKRHRSFVDYMVDRGGHFDPSDEVIFLEKVFALLKGIHGYLQGTMEGERAS